MSNCVSTTATATATAAAPAMTRFLSGRLLIGENVRTLYGIGKVVDFRPSDATYIVHLFRLADEMAANVEVQPEDDSSSISISSRISSSSESKHFVDSETGPSDTSDASSLSLSSSEQAADAAACEITGDKDEPLIVVLATLYTQSVTRIRDWHADYEAIEKKRRSRFERDCHMRGLLDIDHTDCKFCMLKRHEKAMQQQAFRVKGAESHGPRFLRIKKFRDKRKKATVQPCVLCGMNCCSSHVSRMFRKEHIHMCTECEHYFDIKYITKKVSTHHISEREKNVDHIIALYDRCLIKLQFTLQFMDDCANSLEQNEKGGNRIGVGTSGIGVVSGILGIAAAATIVTPVGAPLLIASLMCGVASSLVQRGTDMARSTYFASPKQLAKNIIAVHELLLSLLRVTEALREVNEQETKEAACDNSEGGMILETTEVSTIDQLHQNRPGVMMVSNMGRNATLGYVPTAARFASQTIKFARFAGGAISVAVLALEANSLKQAIQKIRQGDKCKRAMEVREIAKQLRIAEHDGGFPLPITLDKECQAYLNATRTRYSSRRDFRKLGATSRCLVVERSEE